MNTHRLPYIGVTGCTTPAQSIDTIASYRALDGRQPTHALMIGVLASAKSLRGDAMPKWWRRYPKPADIASVFVRDDTVPVINLLHYATGGANGGLADDLSRAMAVAGPLCDGVQVNAAWPNPREIAAFRSMHDGIRIVLQLGPTALATMQYRANDIAARVRDDYGDSITDVLVDVSGGRGIAIDPGHMTRLGIIVSELRAHGTWTIGLAGGLCAEALGAAATCADWRRLLRDGCSIDAEGRIRDNADGGGNLVPALRDDYLHTAVAMAAP